MEFGYGIGEAWVLRRISGVIEGVQLYIEIAESRKGRKCACMFGDVLQGGGY